MKVTFTYCYEEDLTVDQLDALIMEFTETAVAGTHGDHGWINSTYSGR